MVHLLEALGVVMMSVSTAVHFPISLCMTSVFDQEMSWMASFDQQLSALWTWLVSRGVFIMGDDSSATFILKSPIFSVRFQIRYHCPCLSTLFMVASVYGQIDFELCRFQCNQLWEIFWVHFNYFPLPLAIQATIATS